MLIQIIRTFLYILVDIFKGNFRFDFDFSLQYKQNHQVTDLFVQVVIFWEG